MNKQRELAVGPETRDKLAEAYGLVEIGVGFFVLYTVMTIFYPVFIAGCAVSLVAVACGAVRVNKAWNDFERTGM